MTSLHVVTALLAIFLPFTAVQAAGFSDITAAHLNYDAVMYAKQEGMVHGYPDGTFRPDKPINRAEFVKIIMNAVPPEETPPECGRSDTMYLPFSDVGNAAWYAFRLCLAVTSSVVEGYPDGTFRPERTINFVEAAKIVVRAFAIDTSRFTTSYQSWSDWGSEKTDTYWFKPFVDALAEKNTIPDSIATFPQDLTRGEMVEMMYRLKANVTSKKSKTFDGLWGLTYWENYGDAPSPFDGCGPISTYAKHSWYSELEAQGLRRHLEMSEVSEACLSSDTILIFIAPGEGEGQSSRIFQFRQQGQDWVLTQATRNDDYLGLFKAETFGKRNGNLIPVEGKGREGGKEITVRSEYNVTENTVRVMDVVKK